jgi:hypothetical protein
MKNSSAVELGKKSAEKQFGKMTKEEKTTYFRELRLKRKDLQAIQA